LFAKAKRNMTNKLMRLTDKFLSRKCFIIEMVIDQLKNMSQIEHSRHRSPVNCFVNIICGWLLSPAKKALVAIRLGIAAFGLTRTYFRRGACKKNSSKRYFNMYHVGFQD
jgi:Transposase DDE domain